jgi:hypothetical protein
LVRIQQSRPQQAKLHKPNCTSAENFKGAEPLKKLFWSTLNYDQVNKPTSRRGWPDAASSVLDSDPILLAAGGAKGDFQILYSRLAKDQLSLADGRIVTSRLLKDQPLPTGYNAAVMKVKRSFDGEVKQRESERQHTLSPTLGQRYVMRELSVLSRASEDEDQKGQITLPEKAANTWAHLRLLAEFLCDRGRIRQSYSV